MRFYFITLLKCLTTCIVITGCGTNAENDVTNNDNSGTNQTQTSQPNILLIISDDQGKDASNQYNFTTEQLNTPTLDSLAKTGLTLDNFWVTPGCATTRAALLTGQYGIHSGVNSIPATLPENSQTIQSYLKENPISQTYQTGFFGKWHLGGEADYPNQFGIDYFAGNLRNIDDYYQWELNINGQTSISTEYNTSKLTDLAIEWINNTDNNKPWFTWLAYSAPHAPFHLPPSHLQSRDLSGTTADINNNPRAYFLAAIEAMDSEINRLLNSIPTEQLANTIIIYLGDNGTPKRVLDTSKLTLDQSKGSLYEGGINVPAILSGKGVYRQNQREESLINVTDLFSTIANLAGIALHEYADGHSFYDKLIMANEDNRAEMFSSFESDMMSGYAIRNQNYKLIQLLNGNQFFYDLTDTPLESQDLLQNNALTAEQKNQYDQLQAQLNQLLNINQNTDDAIDISNAIFNQRSENCASYVNQYTSTAIDINEVIVHKGQLSISLEADKCVFKTNAIPNHDFNDGDRSFPNIVSAQNDQFSVTSQPRFAAQSTPLSLSMDNAILLNGVKVDLLAAGCYGVGDGKIGCNNMSTPWRYDPMFANNGFSVDSHNAHAQPDGTYHYHGTPNAFYHQDEIIESPVIGFAADGFPIFGPFFNDAGTVRKAQSSYQLKTGPRPTGDDNPPGHYDGTFRDDYQYVDNLGDLDECNGMSVNGVYGYYITDNYPYILACFKGTPDDSFNK